MARQGQRTLVDDRAGSGGGDVDMEYEAQFDEGVMLRHDACNLRLAALRYVRLSLRVDVFRVWPLLLCWGRGGASVFR